jgi:hypothetical protein
LPSLPTASTSAASSAASAFSSQQQQQQLHEGLPPDASVHCLGENFATHADGATSTRGTHSKDAAWTYKTCHFQNICYDRQRSEFIAIASDTEATLIALWEKRSDRSTVTLSTLLSADMNAVSLGPIAADATVASPPPRPWFPVVLTRAQAHARYRTSWWWGSKVPPYAQLASDIVGIPTTLVSPRHPSHGSNDNGRWLWETAYPLFVAAHLFGLTGTTDHQEASRRILSPLLTHDCRKDDDDDCLALRDKLLPIYASTTILPEPLPDLQPDSKEEAEPRLICVKHAVAGMGRLGPSSASSLLEQSDSIGRGTILQAFFEHVQRAVSAATHPDPSSSTRADVAVTEGVTTTLSRPDGPRVLVDTSCQGEVHQALLAQLLEGPTTTNDGISADTWPRRQSAHLTNLTLLEQARLLSQATVLVTCLQGGSMAAPLFLPPQARVFLLYHQEIGPTTTTTTTTTTTGGNDDETSLFSYVWNNAAFLRTTRILTDQTNGTDLRAQIQAALDE